MKSTKQTSITVSLNIKSYNKSTKLIFIKGTKLYLVICNIFPTFLVRRSTDRKILCCEVASGYTDNGITVVNDDVRHRLFYAARIRAKIDTTFAVFFLFSCICVVLLMWDFIITHTYGSLDVSVFDYIIWNTFRLDLKRSTFKNESK